MTELAGISKFSIQRRINDAGMQFDCDFSNALQPDAFRTGNQIHIALNDPNTPDGLTMFEGRCQTIRRDEQNSNKIFGLTGRHIGYYLLRQQYKRGCPRLTGGTGWLYIDMSTTEVLEEILQDTGVTIARSLPEADVVNPVGVHSADAFFCGEFKTKKEAIDALFTCISRYIYGASYKAHRYVWYIDIDGYFKWFETTEDRGNVINISDDHPQLASLNIVEDNTNVVNYIEGYAGANSSIYRSVRNEASITQHGLLQGETIVDTNIIDGNVLLELLNTSIDNTKNPLYTATATFDGLLYTEPGQKHRFPDSDAYSDIEFTIVDITISGTPENHQTVINYSTDVSVLSADNSFEMVKLIVDATVPKPEVATVLYGHGEGSMTATVQTSSGGTLNTKYVGYIQDGDDVLLLRGSRGNIAIAGKQNIYD